MALQSMLNQEVPTQDSSRQTQNIIDNAAKLLHNPESRPNVVEQMKKIQNPLESIGNITSMLMIEMDEQSKGAGVTLEPDAKIAALPDVTALVMELGVAAKVYPGDMSEEEAGGAMAIAVQRYLQHLIITKQVDPNQLQQEIQEGMVNMSPEQQQQLQQTMSGIDQASQQSVQKYGQSTSRPEVQQQVASQATVAEGQPNGTVVPQ